jgi:hypothetical protein
MFRAILERVPFPLTLALAGCNESPDASLCVIYSDDPKPVVFCQNMKTGEAREISLKESHKFYAMSPKDYETVRAWHRKECLTNE